MAEKKGAGGRPQEYNDETGQYVGAHPTKTVEAIRKYSDDPERGHSRIRELAECEQAGGELRQEVWKSNQYSIICCKLHEANRKTIREKP